MMLRYIKNFLPVLVLLLLTIARVQSLKGAITLLAWNLDKAASRNVAIYEKFYKPMRNETVDIIIFHEACSEESQVKLQAMTPDMPIIYINVKDHFMKWKERMAMLSGPNPLCPGSKLSQRFKLGYKLMCWFWYKRFLDYLPVDYAWMLRIGDDVGVLDGFRNPETWSYDWQSPVKVASTTWLQFPTNVTSTPEGIFEAGMNEMTRELLIERKRDFTWTDSGNFYLAPYTNVMYLDINWWRRQLLVREFANRVEESNCIIISRWGDLELWGYNTYIGETKPYLLPFPYGHKSHKCMAKNQYTSNQGSREQYACIPHKANLELPLAWG